MSSKLNEYAYETGRISSFTVSDSSGEALPTDPTRRYALLSNDGAVDCYLAIGAPAEAGKGILLKAGGAYQIDAANMTHAAINAITASDPTTLSIQEGA